MQSLTKSIAMKPIHRMDVTQSRKPHEALYRLVILSKLLRIGMNSVVDKLFCANPYLAKITGSRHHNSSERVQRL